MMESSIIVHSKTWRNSVAVCKRSYLIPRTRPFQIHPTLSSLQSSLISDDIIITPSCMTTFLTSAVPNFDGSTIRDPVVVSSLYWGNLWNSITTWLFTQLVVGIVISFVLIISNSQLISLGEYISNQKAHWLNQDTKEAFPSTAKVKPWRFDTSIYTKPDRVVKLGLCIAIDLLGSLSEFIPIVVATICWIIETYFEDSEVAKALQIGLYARKLDWIFLKKTVVVYYLNTESNGFSGATIVSW